MPGAGTTRVLAAQPGGIVAAGTVAAVAAAAPSRTRTAPAPPTAGRVSAVLSTPLPSR